MQKVVIITGASSGIGLELAKKFINNGDIVYGLSRHEFALDGLNHVICDISKEEDCKNAIDYVINKEHRIDILINNAGMGISGSVENTSEDDAKKIFNINFFGTFHMCKYALKYLRESKGRIINTSSVASKISIPFQSFYSATKAGIDAISAGIRAEAKPYGVQVTTILPGDTKTNFTANRVKQNDGVYQQRYEKSIKTMEHDEQNGMSSAYVAKVIFKTTKKKKAPTIKVVGVQYKFLLALSKILPNRFVEYIVGKIYSK